jgi:2-amino-4-hydroxy-6-hydroxymethyldihydropteridine diphosphokinase
MADPTPEDSFADPAANPAAGPPALTDTAPTASPRDLTRDAAGVAAPGGAPGPVAGPDAERDEQARAPAARPPVERRVYVGLGANQGDMVATLRAAVEALGSIERTRVAAVSPFYRSAPIEAGGGDFVNGVAALDTSLDPYALLLHLADLELHLGRKRRAGEAPHAAPRNIDLDLLLVGSLILRSTPLVLPHPRMQQRAFVLRPLADLDPELHIPGHGPIGRLLERVADQDISALPLQ